MHEGGREVGRLMASATIFCHSTKRKGLLGKRKG